MHKLFNGMDVTRDDVEMLKNAANGKKHSDETVTITLNKKYIDELIQANHGIKIPSDKLVAKAIERYLVMNGKEDKLLWQWSYTD